MKERVLTDKGIDLDQLRSYMNNHHTLENTHVNECETQHPELTQEYKRIMWEQYELFCKKSLSYGMENITHGMDVTKDEGRRYSLNGLFWRLSDKINRLRGLLVFNNKEHLKDETITDTFQDLANYSIIAQIVNNKKWK